MIRTRSDLREYLKIEEAIYRGKTNKLLWRCMLLIPFVVHEKPALFKFIRLLRKTEYYLNNRNVVCMIWYKFRYRYLQYKYGISVPINVFGPGLKIRHLAQTRVSAESKIGANCTIYPFVSIGTNNEGSPSLGDNVSVYSGARVIGGITLADNISVAANAVVTKSCDITGAVLAGIPAKVIKINKL